MTKKYCEYCGELLTEGCDCEEISYENERISHLYDFLLLDCEMGYSEEKALLEYAEHRAG